MKEQTDRLADEVSALEQQVGDLVYDALRAQTRGGTEAESAKEFERQLGRVRRSLSKAESILRHLGAD